VIPLDLVPLTPDERAHERAVLDALEAAIVRVGGWMPFADYMDFVLYAPGLGYYAAGAHKLGAGGDFTTAPEISPVFAASLATQCAEVLATLGGGDLLEIGAGSGALAADVLPALEASGVPLRRYRILETSPDLRERQRARLAALPAGLAARVEWLDAIPDVPFTGLVLANEVLDALPVERFRIEATGVRALGVAWEHGGPRAAWRAAAPELERAVRALGVEFEDGHEGELCLRLGSWLAAVTRPLARGVALFIDYGAARRDYYAPSRARGTFACFHRHRIHDDAFVNVGLQDLTAWVDFTRVAEAALEAGLEVGGYTSQAHFLLGTGFERHLAALRARADAAEEPLLARRAMQLVLPEAMGERFRAIALTRDVDAPLAGFSLRDLTATL
jgi:SAM-dependent MidA family methyltransferase